MAKDLVCASCGYRGAPKRHTKGSMVIELALWLLLIVPGLIYSLWRLSSKYDGCPKCGAPNMIPADSLVAQKILAK